MSELFRAPLAEPAARVAVIGAGMAGITCARRLKDRGFDAVLFDKGRSLGGRLATRQSGAFRFDHGAPSVHADRLAFFEVLKRLADVGAATAIETLGQQTVGLPGMNTLLAPLTEDLEVHLSTGVTSLIQGKDGWTLGLDGKAPMIGFDGVALAIPADQAAALIAPLGLAGLDAWQPALADIRYAPTMTMMAAFADRLPLADEARPADGHDLAKQIRNSAKPERPTAPDHWVVHADLAWSIANLNTSKEDIADALLARFFAANDLAPRPTAYLGGHRWKFSRTSVPLGRSHLFDGDHGIGLAGDWCLGPNAEHAFESGLMLAEAIATSLEG